MRATSLPRSETINEVIRLVKKFGNALNWLEKKGVVIEKVLRKFKDDVADIIDDLVTLTALYEEKYYTCKDCQGDMYCEEREWEQGFAEPMERYNCFVTAKSSYREWLSMCLSGDKLYVTYHSDNGITAYVVQVSRQ